MNVTYSFYSQDLHVDGIFIGSIDSDGNIHILDEAVEFGIVHGFDDAIGADLLISIIENAEDEDDLKSGVGSQAFKNACDKYGVRNTEG